MCTRRLESRRPEHSDDVPSHLLLPGPSDTQQLFQWPLVVPDTLDEAMRTRLLHHYSVGVEFISEYAGVDCVREAMECSLMGWQRRLPEFIGKLEFPIASDIGHVQRQVLTQVAQCNPGPDGKPTCVFGDIGSKLPKVASDWLSACEPSGESQQEAEEAYRQMAAYLLENRAWIFAKGGKAWCHSHNSWCPVHPQFEKPTQLDVSKLPRRASLDHASRARQQPATTFGEDDCAADGDEEVGAVKFSVQTNRISAVRTEK